MVSRGKAFADRWMPVPIAGNPTGEQHERLRVALEQALAQSVPEIVRQLDRRGIQRLLEDEQQLTREMSDQIGQLVRMRALRVEQFPEEEVASEKHYGPGYREKLLPGQVTLLRELFPGLKSAHCNEVMARYKLPEAAEAWFAIPRWQVLGASYAEAVERVFAVMASRRRFENRICGKMGPEFLRESDRAAQAWDLIGKSQDGADILVIPAQAGMRHRGRSARRAAAMMDSNEFGLGTFATAILLLMHPERVCNGESLMIDASGDEYSLHGNGEFLRVPLFDFGISGLECSVFYRERARAMWGTPSGFVVQVVA